MHMIETLIEGHDVSDARKANLTLAIAAGASDETLEILRDTNRISRTDTIVLPAHRFENLSRGRGWCRKGKGSSAVWGEREDEGGYRVGPGRWTVGGNDGFSRKKEDTWIVKHVAVGAETWTIAD